MGATGRPVASTQTKFGDSMKCIKWLGTLLCLTGICLTSFNIYPTNIILSLIGSALWTYAGWKQQDTPLFLVEAVAVVFYVAGVITLFY
jgi:multidrug transporter EmrE-like cation transporter